MGKLKFILKMLYYDRLYRYINVAKDKWMIGCLLMR